MERERGMHGVRVNISHFFPVVLHISDLPPGEGDLGRELVFSLVDIQPKSIDSKPQRRALLVLERRRGEGGEGAGIKLTEDCEVEEQNTTGAGTCTKQLHSHFTFTS